MRESESYMAILDEGAIATAQKFILFLGQKSYGAPGESVMATLDAMEDLERLERIFKRISDVKTWEELLETP